MTELEYDVFFLSTARSCIRCNYDVGYSRVLVYLLRCTPYDTCWNMHVDLH